MKKVIDTIISGKKVIGCNTIKRSASKIQDLDRVLINGRIFFKNGDSLLLENWYKFGDNDAVLQFNAHDYGVVTEIKFE